MEPDKYSSHEVSAILSCVNSYVMTSYVGCTLDQFNLLGIREKATKILRDLGFSFDEHIRVIDSGNGKVKIYLDPKGRLYKSIGLDLLLHSLKQSAPSHQLNEIGHLRQKYENDISTSNMKYEVLVRENEKIRETLSKSYEKIDSLVSDPLTPLRDRVNSFKLESEVEAIDSFDVSLELPNGTYWYCKGCDSKIITGQPHNCPPRVSTGMNSNLVMDQEWICNNCNTTVGVGNSHGCY